MKILFSCKPILHLPHISTKSTSRSHSLTHMPVLGIPPATLRSQTHFHYLCTACFCCELRYSLEQLLLSYYILVICPHPKFKYTSCHHSKLANAVLLLLRRQQVARPWQIIPKDSPIILFFYSQIFSLLFSQTSPLFFQTSLLFLHYSQTHIKNFINILMIYNIIIIQKQSLIRNSCIAS